MAQTDEELLVQAIRGDEEALSELLARHGPWIRSRLASKIPAHFQSVLSEDDVLQVTYLDAFLNIVRFQPQGPGSFPAWLARIAENNLLNALKSLKAGKRPDPSAVGSAVRTDRSHLVVPAAAGPSAAKMAAPQRPRSMIHQL